VAVRGSGPSLVRPEFGPTLPALLQRRLGIPRRVTLAAVALLLAAAMAATAVRLSADDTVELVHRGPPAFTLLYVPEVVRPAPPRGGELVRLGARTGGVVLSITLRPLRLPPYRGVAAGALPVHAKRHIASLRSNLDGFDLRGEGKARVNDVPGYQVAFRAGRAPRRIYGRDVLVVPDRPGARDGVVISMLQANTGAPLTAADLEAIAVAKKAFRSFRFGTERP
jgi:hypothetical protein